MNDDVENVAANENLSAPEKKDPYSSGANFDFFRHLFGLFPNLEFLNTVLETLSKEEKIEYNFILLKAFFYLSNNYAVVYNKNNPNGEKQEADKILKLFGAKVEYNKFVIDLTHPWHTIFPIVSGIQHRNLDPIFGNANYDFLEDRIKNLQVKNRGAEIYNKLKEVHKTVDNYQNFNGAGNDPQQIVELLKGLDKEEKGITSGQVSLDKEDYDLMDKATLAVMLQALSCYCGYGYKDVDEEAIQKQELLEVFCNRQHVKLIDLMSINNKEVLPNYSINAKEKKLQEVLYRCFMYLNYQNSEDVLTFYNGVDSNFAELAEMPDLLENINGTQECDEDVYDTRMIILKKVHLTRLTYHLYSVIICFVLNSLSIGRNMTPEEKSQMKSQITEVEDNLGNFLIGTVMEARQIIEDKLNKVINIIENIYQDQVYKNFAEKCLSTFEDLVKSHIELNELILSLEDDEIVSILCTENPLLQINGVLLSLPEGSTNEEIAKFLDTKRESLQKAMGKKIPCIEEIAKALDKDGVDQTKLAYKLFCFRPDIRICINQVDDTFTGKNSETWAKIDKIRICINKIKRGFKQFQTDRLGLQVGKACVQLRYLKCHIISLISQSYQNLCALEKQSFSDLFYVRPSLTVTNNYGEFVDSIRPIYLLGGAASTPVGDKIDAWININVNPFGTDRLQGYLKNPFVNEIDKYFAKKVEYYNRMFELISRGAKKIKDSNDFVITPSNEFVVITSLEACIKASEYYEYLRTFYRGVAANDIIYKLDPIKEPTSAINTGADFTRQMGILETAINSLGGKSVEYLDLLRGAKDCFFDVKDNIGDPTWITYWKNARPLYANEKIFKFGINTCFAKYSEKLQTLVNNKGKGNVNNLYPVYGETTLFRETIKYLIDNHSDPESSGIKVPQDGKNLSKMGKYLLEVALEIYSERGGSRLTNEQKAGIVNAPSFGTKDGMEGGRDENKYVDPVLNREWIKVQTIFKAEVTNEEVGTLYGRYFMQRRLVGAPCEKGFIENMIISLVSSMSNRGKFNGVEKHLKRYENIVTLLEKGKAGNREKTSKQKDLLNFLAVNWKDLDSYHKNIFFAFFNVIDDNGRVVVAEQVKDWENCRVNLLKERSSFSGGVFAKPSRTKFERFIKLFDLSTKGLGKMFIDENGEIFYNKNLDGSLPSFVDMYGGFDTYGDEQLLELIKMSKFSEYIYYRVELKVTGDVNIDEILRSAFIITQKLTQPQKPIVELLMQEQKVVNYDMKGLGLGTNRSFKRSSWKQACKNYRRFQKGGGNEQGKWINPNKFSDDFYKIFLSTYPPYSEYMFVRFRDGIFEITNEGIVNVPIEYSDRGQSNEYQDLFSAENNTIFEEVIRTTTGNIDVVKLITLEASAREVFFGELAMALKYIRPIILNDLSIAFKVKSKRLRYSKNKNMSDVVIDLSIPECADNWLDNTTSRLSSLVVTNISLLSDLINSDTFKLFINCLINILTANMALYEKNMTIAAINILCYDSPFNTTGNLEHTGKFKIKTYEERVKEELNRMGRVDKQEVEIRNQTIDEELYDKQYFFANALDKNPTPTEKIEEITSKLFSIDTSNQSTKNIDKIFASLDFTTTPSAMAKYGQLVSLISGYKEEDKLAKITYELKKCLIQMHMLEKYFDFLTKFRDTFNIVANKSAFNVNNVEDKGIFSWMMIKQGSPVVETVEHFDNILAEKIKFVYAKMTEMGQK